MKSLIYLVYFMVGLPEFLSQDTEGCYEKVFDGLDFPGNDVHQSVVEDEHSCQRKCTEEPRCQFFTFVKKEFHNEVQRYVCYLKNNEKGTPSRITFLWGVMSGFSLRKCGLNDTGCVHELVVDTDFPGNDIESVFAPDVNYCQKLCTEHKNCQFFTYLTSDWNSDQRRFYCYIKQNKRGEPTIKTELQNVVSGYSLKQCETYNSCFKDMFVDLDFPGDDFRQFVVEDEHSCQRECTEEPDCQFFTFANGLYRNTQQRYICYLKKSERGTPSNIITLENVVSGFPLRECGFNKSVSECQTDLFEDLDFPGNDITWVLAPDANICQRICTDHPQCLFFTFVKKEWNTDHRRFYCYLKQTATGTVSRKTKLQNVVSGFSLKRCTNLISRCYEKIFDGLDFPGNDIHQSVVEDEHSCQRKCTEEPRCQFFTFVKKEFHNEVQRYVCYLKNNEKGTPSRITVLWGVTSGFPLRKCELNDRGCVHELFANTDFPGNDIESVFAPDVNYCQKLCTEHKSCQFFTYLTSDWNSDQRRFYCYIKQNKRGEPTIKTELQNVVSGYSLKQCETYNSCFKDMFVDLDFPGDDFRQFVVEDEHSCQRECTEEPDCQFFTFANGLYRNTQQRYICYLKKSERGTPSNIITLENVVSGFPLRECGFNKSVSECQTDLFEDLDFPGNDITWVLAPDANICQRICTDHPQCLFFTFVKKEWNTDHRRFYCYLKQTATGTVSRKTKLQNVVSGFSLKRCTNLISRCYEKIFDGLDFPGNDIHQSVVEDEHSCQRKCTEEPRCQFFTFVKKEFHNEVQRYVCYLKNNEKGTPSRITVLWGVTSGFPLRKCELNDRGCVHELFANTDFPGNDIESVFAPDVNYCQKLCTEHKSCQFFTYLTSDWNTDQRRFYCYLKKNMEGEPVIKTELQNVVSGYSLKQCETYNSCFKDMFVDLDFPGDDFRQFVVEDEHSCQRECTEEPDCQFFTFVNGLYRNTQQRYICYLKKSKRGTPSKITALENVVSGFPLRECVYNKSVSECRSEIFEDIDFPGNDITWVLAPDVSFCQKVCTYHPQCLFFTFVKREWSTDHRRFYCYLKQTASGMPSRLTMLQNVVSGFSLKWCKNLISPCASSVYEGLDFPGEDFQNFSTRNYQDCQKECTNDKQCQFFTYVNQSYHRPLQRQVCYLKQSIRATPSKIKLLNNVVSGFSLKGCRLSDQVCDKPLLQNVDFPGNDIKNVLAPSAETCQLICTYYPNCLFFTYLRNTWTKDSRKNWCYLKKTNTGLPTLSTPLTHVVTGYSLRSCRDFPDCESNVFYNRSFEGKVLQVKQVESYGDCQESCTDHRQCQFFTFEETYDQEMYSCYLQKSDNGLPSKIDESIGAISGFSLRLCTLNQTCGKVYQPKSHVSGGTVSLPGEWPWQVSIHIDQEDEFGHFCGGAIISDHWIITAAHCFERTEDLRKWRIYAGITKLSDITNKITFHKIEKIIIHENYNSETMDCDIALLKLKQAIVFDDYQMPICLPTSEEQVPLGSHCWITGWGKTETGQISQILLKANIPVIDDERCRSVYSGSMITENMMCAGKDDGNVDRCKGDSGSPLACEHNGKWYLVGITSWGHGCAKKEKPGIYTRLPKLQAWVHKKVSDASWIES